MRNLGYNPTELSYQQQMQLAERFMGSINSANSIVNTLHNPFSHLAQISGIEPNNGLNKPATDGMFINQLNNKEENINSKIEDFKENPGNQIGDQLLEQGKTAGKVAKNIADPYIDLFENK